jgi:hypothetical protein
MGSRKNTRKYIQWFVEKFKDNPNVGLNRKRFIRNNSTIDKTQNRTPLAPNVSSDVKCKVYLNYMETCQIQKW